jgi:hypothetical protein
MKPRVEHSKVARLKSRAMSNAADTVATVATVAM